MNQWGFKRSPQEGPLGYRDDCLKLHGHSSACTLADTPNTQPVSFNTWYKIWCLQCWLCVIGELYLHIPYELWSWAQSHTPRSLQMVGSIKNAPSLLSVWVELRESFWRVELSSELCFGSFGVLGMRSPPAVQCFTIKQTQQSKDRDQVAVLPCKGTGLWWSGWAGIRVNTIKSAVRPVEINTFWKGYTREINKVWYGRQAGLREDPGEPQPQPWERVKGRGTADALGVLELYR